MTRRFIATHALVAKIVGGEYPEEYYYRGQVLPAAVPVAECERLIAAGVAVELAPLKVTEERTDG